jgi:hypothetical protein
MIYGFLCNDYRGNQHVSIHFSGHLSYRVSSTSDEKKVELIDALKSSMSFTIMIFIILRNAQRYYM